MIQVIAAVLTLLFTPYTGHIPPVAKPSFTLQGLQLDGKTKAASPVFIPADSDTPAVAIIRFMSPTTGMCAPIIYDGVNTAYPGNTFEVVSNTEALSAINLPDRDALYSASFPTDKYIIEVICESADATQMFYSQFYTVPIPSTKPA